MAVRGASAGATITGRLATARRRDVVGRHVELGLIRELLGQEDRRLVALFLHGPGGIGKTTVVQAAADLAEDAGRTAVQLDGRAIERSRLGFRAAVAEALALPADTPDPLLTADTVLLIDTFEAIAALETWLRREFLPAQAAGALLIAAGRMPPEPGWRTDPGWQSLTRAVALRNLDPAEAQELLRSRAVPDELVDELAAATHGHPLAIVVAADLVAHGDGAGGRLSARDLAAHPDLTAALLARFVDEVDEPRQRQALQLLAHTRRVDRALVRRVLSLTAEDADDVLGWLRARPYVTAGPEGLWMHDVARDALDRDLQWRDREGYTDLHRRVRAVIVERAERGSEREQQHAFTDLLFLHRNNPAAAGLHAFESLGAGLTRRATAADAHLLATLAAGSGVPGHEQRVRHWHAVEPTAFLVHEDGAGRPLGFIPYIRLDRTSAPQRAADPAASWIWDELLPSLRPPRPGEPVLYAVDAVGEGGEGHDDGYGPVTDMHATASLSAWMLPKLGWAVIATRREAFWAPMWTYIGFSRLGGISVDGHDVAVWGWDFARTSFAEWLEALAVTEVGGESPRIPRAPVALSAPDFADAVRRALREVRRPDQLERSPLVASRLVGSCEGDRLPGAVLAARIAQAVAALGDTARDERCRRALDRTYLRPAPTQEAAAEVLGLPFSTYRRHLADGLERLVEVLWSWELYGPPPLSTASEQ
jgi:hypothetical protein